MNLPQKEPILDIQNRRLCSGCVEEKFLCAEIKGKGDGGTCFYCKLNGKTFSIDQVAHLIDDVLSVFFFHTFLIEDEPLNPKCQPVAEVIGDSAGLSEDAVEDIRQVLATRHEVELGYISTTENPFDQNAHYTRRDTIYAWDIEADWLRFEQSLKSETRYFNPTAEAILISIFKDIETLRIFGRPIVVEAGPDTELAVFYRARVFQAETKLREALKQPEKSLGPPPALVASAGRMNASGIPVFYGSTNPTIALAEVRPPIGSKVLIGKFDVLLPLKLLDLDALRFVADEKDGSLFDENHVAGLKRTEFLRGLSRRISKPVMPDDQPRDYLPTQAIADFLATRTTPALDGIIYSPAQTTRLRSTYERFLLGSRGSSRNIILFHKSANVQASDIPENADISVTEESWFPWFLPLPSFGFEDEGITYTVWEKVTESESSLYLAQLKLSSLEVHYVNGITYNTTSKPVNRYQENPKLDEKV